jgi:hypothetical protein
MGVKKLSYVLKSEAGLDISYETQYTDNLHRALYVG